MNKSRLFLLLSIFLIILYPIFTIINYIFNYFNIVTYFYIININICGFDWFLIEYAYPFWKIFAIIIMSIKILLFIVLPIISYIKKKKLLYIVQFAIVFLDFFCIMALPGNYIIVMLNMFYHIITLVILAMSIKCINELNDK